MQLHKKFTKFDKTHTFMDDTRVEQGREHSVCVIDSIPSQANRIEPAFARLKDKEGKPVRLVPVVTIKAKIKTENGEEEQIIDLLEAGHRAADAVVQLSTLRKTLMEAIRERKRGNSEPLAKIAPTSLVFGMWDSRESGIKVPRLLNSIIRAYDVLEHRRSSQFNAALDFRAAGIVPDKKEKKLSAVGMDSAPAAFQLGGIMARGGICRDASLNLCTIRDIVTDQADDSKKTWQLRRYILGLTLVALTYLDAKILNLRQGCQLVADKPMTRVLVNADGTEKPFEINHEMALEYARQAAKEFVVGEDQTDIKFDPKRAKAALKKTKKDDQEDSK